jgi:formylglycine-generating enzyme required for sulfatase activity
MKNLFLFAMAIFGSAATLAVDENYTTVIPGTTVSYSMVAIPAGSFLIGSPTREKNRRNDEGPQITVTVPAFWMGAREVTWNEYELFMFPKEPPAADATTHPTKPYVEMSFGMGRDGYPAISMTQHAANKYCQWLSAKTGHFYRLPTEAEWEYAARAGTTTAYSFGDSPAKLKDYAVFNSDRYAKVGSKKPNPWGLYDMHGNVLEWTLDQYSIAGYAQLAAQLPWIVSVTPYPHSVRGGSWADTAAQLRSAARRGSEANWKRLDPQRPKSIWYHTNAPWIGFRIVRPAIAPSTEEMHRYWNNGVERDE